MVASVSCVVCRRQNLIVQLLLVRLSSSISPPIASSTLFCRDPTMFAWLCYSCLLYYALQPTAAHPQPDLSNGLGIQSDDFRKLTCFFESSNPNADSTKSCDGAHHLDIRSEHGSNVDGGSDSSERSNIAPRAQAEYYPLEEISLPIEEDDMLRQPLLVGNKTEWAYPPVANTSLPPEDFAVNHTFVAEGKTYTVVIDALHWDLNGIIPYFDPLEGVYYNVTLGEMYGKFSVMNDTERRTFLVNEMNDTVQAIDILKSFSSSTRKRSPPASERRVRARAPGMQQSKVAPQEPDLEANWAGADPRAPATQLNNQAAQPQGSSAQPQGQTAQTSDQAAQLGAQAGKNQSAAAPEGGHGEGGYSGPPPKVGKGLYAWDDNPASRLYTIIALNAWTWAGGRGILMTIMSYWTHRGISEIVEGMLEEWLSMWARAYLVYYAELLKNPPIEAAIIWPSVCLYRGIVYELLRAKSWFVKGADTSWRRRVEAHPYTNIPKVGPDGVEKPSNLPDGSSAYFRVTPPDSKTARDALRRPIQTDNGALSAELEEVRDLLRSWKQAQTNANPSPLDAGQRYPNGSRFTGFGGDGQGQLAGGPLGSAFPGALYTAGQNGQLALNTQSTTRSDIERGSTDVNFLHFPQGEAVEQLGLRTNSSTVGLQPQPPRGPQQPNPNAQAARERLWRIQRQQQSQRQQQQQRQRQQQLELQRYQQQQRQRPEQRHGGWRIASYSGPTGPPYSPSRISSQSGDESTNEISESGASHAQLLPANGTGRSSMQGQYADDLDGSPSPPGRNLSNIV